VITAETTTNPVLAFLLLVSISDVSGSGLLAGHAVVAVDTVDRHVSIEHGTVLSCTRITRTSATYRLLDEILAV